ncbi:hypothetical protein RHGRI_005746 [Rhododendron griersonianum]|uniref:adenylate kinase n=1 Tax=Rhododendron griersonianum TaxID=479676 RepID=A0AAV6LEF1_9ERIC|nr:hypothetical protein RHGRI_005746 [Rhododendron griersonianum]
MIASHFGFHHLSAGDLLEEEVKSGSDIGKLDNHHPEGTGKIGRSATRWRNYIDLRLSIANGACAAGVWTLKLTKLLSKGIATLFIFHRSMIKSFKMDGKLVPVEIVIELLHKAMHKRKDGKFLIDGFPRNEENRVAAENIMKIEPEFVLFFECSTETMTKRLLNRNQIDGERSIEEVFAAVKSVFSEGDQTGM